MKINFRRYIRAQTAYLSLWPIFMFAQTADLSKGGPAVCNNSTVVCEASNRIQPQPPADQSKVPTANHQRNVSACRNGWAACDRSKLTATEAVALAIAEHEQNISRCKSGLGFCDRSRLSATEANEVDIAAHQRNLYDCTEAWVSCKHELL